MVARIDTSELKRFAVQLRKSAPELSKEFNAGLRAGGELVAQQAKSNASFSSRIPGSIKVRRAGVKVTVSAGGASAPEAAPLEHGGQPGTFRHPVFGNREVWVNQPARPFLMPAVEAEAENVAVLVLNACDGVFRQMGF